MKIDLSKAVKTNQITQDEAEEWFVYLRTYTNQYIKTEYPFYYKNGYWPIKAQKRLGGETKPKFTICHHTSNKKGDYKPALHRFMSSKMASSNFLIGEKQDELFYLVDVKNMSYHAYNNSGLSPAVARLLNLQKGWIQEVGTEIAGNGTMRPFSYEQFLNVICLHRYLFSYFPTLEEIKSHRFFSPITRKGDPGVYFMLPLVEHAVKNDIDLTSEDYWLEQYKKDPQYILNMSGRIIENFGLTEKDEWKKERKKL